MVIQWDEPQELSGLVTVSSSTTIYLRPTVWTVNDVLGNLYPFWEIYTSFCAIKRVYISQDVIDGPHCSFFLNTIAEFPSFVQKL
jgi:hypothetical protein